MINKYKFDENNLIDTKSIGFQTLVGYCTKKYPIVNGGNCFSLETDNKNIRIVNFGVENLKHLLKEKILDWPVKVFPITETLGAILDKRVPKEYYWTKFCSICCPFEYLPTTQKLELWDQQLKGELEITQCDGFLMTKYKINPNPMRKLKGEWTCEIDTSNCEDFDLKCNIVEGPGFIFAPWIPIMKEIEP